MPNHGPVMSLSSDEETMTDSLSINPNGNPAPLLINVYGAMPTGDINSIVNEYSVLTIPAFWSGVRFLSETLAGMPKCVFKRDGTARQPVEHPVNKMLTRQANPFATPFTVMEVWHSHAVVFGNGYLYIQRDPVAGRPIALHNINPNNVLPFRYDGQPWFLIKDGLTDKDGRQKDMVVTGSDVAHLHGLGFDGMLGHPLVQLMQEAFELARNSQKFASRYFKKGTQIQGAIEIPGTATKEQIDAITDRVRRAHSGIESDFSYTVLTGGAKLTNNTVPPEQSQLLESRQFSVLDMCRILRVPPHIVYDLGRATWANIESMGIEVVKYSLLPWIERAQQELSLKLLSESEQDNGLYIRYSVDSLMRGDTATQTNTTLALVNGGLLTANEGRAILDMPPSDDPTANKLRVPVNFPVATAPSPETKSTEPTQSTNPKNSESVPDAVGEQQDFASQKPRKKHWEN